MGIKVNDKSSQITVPSGTKVTFPNMFTLVKGDKVVAEVDGVFDFADVDPRYHMMLANLIMQQRMRLMMPSDEWYAEQDARIEQERKARAEWRALPWWRKLWTPRP